MNLGSLKIGKKSLSAQLRRCQRGGTLLLTYDDGKMRKSSNNNAAKVARSTKLRFGSRKAATPIIVAVVVAVALVAARLLVGSSTSNPLTAPSNSQRPTVASSPADTTATAKTSPSLPRAPTATLPSVVGLSFAKAVTTLQGHYFSVQVSSAASNDIAPGDVISQLPNGEQTVEAGSIVEIVVSTGTVAPSALPICAPSQLKLSFGDRVSEATQQITWDVAITNVSTSSCQLEGFPRVLLTDAKGKAIPFTYTTAGDQMTTAGPPQPVAIAPGQYGFVRLNKNSCETGNTTMSATTLELTLPASQSPLTLSTSRAPLAFDYCSGPLGGIIAISPIEPAELDLFGGPITQS